MGMTYLRFIFFLFSFLSFFFLPSRLCKLLPSSSRACCTFLRYNGILKTAMQNFREIRVQYVQRQFSSQQACERCHYVSFLWTLGEAYWDYMFNIVLHVHGLCVVKIAKSVGPWLVLTLRTWVRIHLQAWIYVRDIYVVFSSLG